MNFYREIFRNAPDEIVVPEYLRNRTVELIILPLTKENEISKKSIESDDEFTKNQHRKFD